LKFPLSWGQLKAAISQNGFARMHTRAALNWDDLRFFLAVARNGSAKAAAKSLRVNQSTVHRRLDELEDKLGQQLATRSSTGYRLSELGHDVLKQAARIEKEVEAFERRVSAWGQQYVGIVRATCPEALAPRLIRSGLIQRFNAKYPDIRVEFVMSDKILNLGKGEADIAIRGLPSAENALFGRKIADTRWAVYASRSYVKCHGRIKAPKDIDQHHIISFGGALAGHPTVRWLRSVAPRARIAARADSMFALLMAVKSGVGLAPIPVIIGDAAPDLVRLIGPIPDLSTPFYLLMHRDMRKTPRVRAFFDFFVEELPKLRPIIAGRG
jgi:DNA-binding transcriptional LysR family regulator